MKRQKASKISLIAIVVCLIFYLWPLAGYHQNLAGGEGDSWAHAGMTQWFCEHFFRYDFQATEFLAPYGVNLANGYDAPLPLSLSCLLKPFGPVAMFNLYAAIQIILVIITSLFLARRYLRQPSLQLGFVLLSTFSGFMLARMTNHYNLVATVWGVNVIILLFDRLNFSNRRQVIASFLGLTVVLLSSWQNIPNLFILTTILIVKQLFSFTKDGTTIVSFKHPPELAIRNSLLGLVVSLLVFLPFSLPMISASFSDELPGATNDLGFASIYSLITPWKTHPLYPLTPEFIRNQTPFESIIGIDWLVLGLFLALTCFNAIKRKRVIPRWYYLAIILYLVVSTGIEIKLATTQLSLGYWESLYRIIPFSLTRFPSRVAVVLIPQITLASFQLLEDLLKRYCSPNIRKCIGLVVCLYAIAVTLILPGNWHAPYAQHDTLLPKSGLEQIKNDPQQVNVLNIPLALASDQMQTFFQAFHRKPLIGGYVSYRSLTETHAQFILNQPALYNLDCKDHGYGLISNVFKLVSSPSNYNRYFLQTLQQLQVGYLIINHDYLQQHDICHQVQDFVDQQLPHFQGIELMEANSQVSLYRVTGLAEAEVDLPALFMTPATSEWVEVGETSAYWLTGNQALHVFSAQSGMADLVLDLQLLPEATQAAHIAIETDYQLVANLDVPQSGVYQTSFPLRAGHTRIGLLGSDCYQQTEGERHLCVTGQLKDIQLVLQP
jgi:hypothetical protein